MLSILYGMFHKLLNPSIAGSLRPALKHIESNLGDPELDNTILAHKCNLSETHFRKLFLSRFGITPRQFVIEARINKAKQLLTDGSLKIGAVAEACGFSNQYHFSRCFKTHTGQTPTQYSVKNKSSNI
jgi:AraC family transcriptional regulator